MTATALFLDLDNTLIDTETTMRGAFLTAFSEITGGPLASAVADRAWEMWLTDPGGWYARYEAGELTVGEQRYRRFVEVVDTLDGLPLTADDFERWRLRYMNGVIETSRPFDDTVAFLDLVAGLPLAVVTNVETATQEAKIAAAGLAAYLPDVFGADLADRAKPDPALFKIACGQLRVDAADVVHVGDSWDADVIGAQNAGMRAVWLDRDGVGRDRPLPDGVQRVTSLAEIPALIGR